MKVLVELPPLFGRAPAQVVAVGRQEDDALVEGQPHLTHGGREGADERVDGFHRRVVGVELGVFGNAQGGQPVGVVLVPAQGRGAVLVDLGPMLLNFFCP